MYFLALLFFTLHNGVDADIVVDFNCTHYNGSNMVYDASATICSNVRSDESCAALYPPLKDGDLLPATGNNASRPVHCFSASTSDPPTFSQDMKDEAISACPKTCGFCCQTSAYSCDNVQNPRLDCKTITQKQCEDPNWRTIIAQDCPNACGLCNEGGCVDAVPDCKNDIAICNEIGMQDFVDKYCQRTCNRCGTTTAQNGNSTPLPVDNCPNGYAPDSSPSCKSWAANGFCTSVFYTHQEKVERCATTCKVC